MFRSISLLLLGILVACLLTAAISVYVFHDVDKDKLGQPNETFVALCFEAVLFGLLVCVPTWLLTFLGRRLLHLTASSPRPILALLLGFIVTVFQYPWEFAGRKFFTSHAGSFLSSYIIIAIVVCTAVLLRDNFKQIKLVGA